MTDGKAERIAAARARLAEAKKAHAAAKKTLERAKANNLNDRAIATASRFVTLSEQAVKTRTKELEQAWES